MIQIEKEILYPEPEEIDTSLPPDWPIESMEAGDSFLTGPIRRMDMIWHQRNWGRPGKAFRAKEESRVGSFEAIYRVWRIK
jgi:hypothetical protein